MDKSQEVNIRLKRPGINISFDTGLSAYEIAVKNGYVGTESSWLASLKAPATEAAAAANSAAESANEAATRVENAVTKANSAAQAANDAAALASQYEEQINKIVSYLSKNATFAGIATPDTDPGTPDGPVFYLATEPGTYTNFSGVIVGQGLTVLANGSGSWKATVLYSLIQTPGYDKNAVMSQDATTTFVSKSVNKEIVKRFVTNLVDKDKILDGYYINPNTDSPAIASSPNVYYCQEEYIPLIPGEKYSLIGLYQQFCFFYDKNKNSLGTIDAVVPPENGSYRNGITITIPENVRYIRYTSIYSFSEAAIYSGDFIPDIQKDFLKDYVSLDLIEISGDNIVVNPENCTFIESKNLYNEDDPNFTKGYYLDTSTGLPTQKNDLYNTTGYINIRKSQIGKYIVGSRDNNGVLPFRFYVFCDMQKRVIASGQNADTAVEIPENARYFRASLLASYANPQIEINDDGSRTIYTPYSLKINKDLIPEQEASSTNSPQLDSILGQTAGTVSQDTLGDGEKLSLPDFPFYLKKGLCMSLYAKVTSMGEILIGKGYKTYRGEWLKIDATNIVCQYWEKGPDIVDRATVPHGLTIGNFIGLSMLSDSEGHLKVTLNTDRGSFITDFSVWSTEANGETFVMCSGMSLTDVKLNATNTDFRKPVWAFGDSYFGIDSGRWPGVLKSMGYFNYLINGLAGQRSSGAYADLTKCLAFGTPKYLLWCLGMNDDGSSFKTYFDAVKELCASKGITLVAALIPSVPSMDKTEINNHVKASGVRYIDFYTAVGATPEGTWYEGMLYMDNVHPTSLGAKALAMRVLVDFPELMQYGFYDPDSLSENL